ncbi:unnamed protein product [Miscanthus lutarioriparius]|uniref:Uncharacterized protein n=1 Tax=Miscanthus lutarioriparius TaxID=422564 RepID=A0A811PNY3_9POAL|nr:unnamed protein product [Miscanthus lutarioriparius]
MANHAIFYGATQLVLQAHKEAVNSLGENGPAKLGTVATVVAVANATAIEATKEDIRARDSTINEIEEKLQETAEAVETAASAARSIDEERRFLRQNLNVLLRFRESEEKAKLLVEERSFANRERFCSSRSSGVALKTRKS